VAADDASSVAHDLVTLAAKTRPAIEDGLGQDEVEPDNHVH